MTFFNKKEEVLDIKLTQFGKQLLSTGRFKPVYYAFFDDNILYDGSAGGISEKQNDIEQRIQEDTPQGKTQHLRSSVETNFSRYRDMESRLNGSMPEIDRIRIQATPEREFALPNPLGHSDFESTSAPAWKIFALTGEGIQKSTYFLTGAYQDLPIPQVDIKVTYVTRVLSEEASEDQLVPGDLIPGQSGPPGTDSISFSNGSTINISVKNGNQDLLLMIEENGVNFEKENFEMEVLYLEPSDGSYRSLSFVENKSNIVDGLITSEKLPETIFPDVDDSYVQYYFDINTDMNIGNTAICAAISNVKSKGIYIDHEIDCENIISSPVTISPYGQVTDPVCED